MRKYIICLLATLSFAGAAGAAADERGNGGKGFACRDANGQVTSLELIDLYKARTQWQMPIAIENVGNDPVQSAANLIARWPDHDAGRKDLLTGFVRTFQNEARFLAGVVLDDPKDAPTWYRPGTCGNEVTIAIQPARNFKLDPVYIVSEDLWRKLSVESQAALIVHEAVYRLAKTEGHTDAGFVHYIIASLAANRFVNMSLEEHEAFFNSVGLKPYLQALRRGEPADATGRYFFYVPYTKYLMWKPTQFFVLKSLLDGKFQSPAAPELVAGVPPQLPPAPRPRYEPSAPAGIFASCWFTRVDTFDGLSFSTQSGVKHINFVKAGILARDCADLKAGQPIPKY